MSQSKLNFYTKALLYFVGRFILNLKYMTGYSSKYDLKLKFKTQDGGGRTIFKTGSYEEDLTNYLINNLDLGKGDIVFDVGANIGWYSNLLSKHFSGIEVHSFEPDPINYEILTTNLKKNNVKGVFANNTGLGEKTETKKLYLYKKSNLGRHSMLNINNGPTIDVHITCFDEYVQKKELNLSNIKFLKIDIEGYEYAAFLGGKEFLKNVPMIMAEFSPGYMRKGGLEPADLLNLLYSFDFKPFTISGLELKAITKEDLLTRTRNINLIWKKV